MSITQRSTAFCMRSWWVVAFVLGVAVLYERGLQKPKFLQEQLKKQMTALQIEKQQALEKQKNLELQINSQSDLAWVELILMKGLGLTPEGQRKIYFYSESHEKPSKASTNSLRKQ